MIDITLKHIKRQHYFFHCLNLMMNKKNAAKHIALQHL